MKTILTFAVRSVMIAGLAWFFCPAARAANVLVQMTEFDTFSPNTSSINAGDSVTWTNTSFVSHNSTSTSSPQLWASSTFTTPSTFTHTFPNAGSFPYECTIHVAEDMFGTITVATVTVAPPTVTITSPTNNATFSAPASFTLSATASVSGATISQVQFFQGNTSLATVTSSPYQASVGGLAAGAYTFSAVATASGGGTATNSINVQVNPSSSTPLVLSSPQWVSPTVFQFSYSTDIGTAYAVDSTSSFSVWTALQTNTASSSSTVFSATNPGAGPLFYRVRRL